MLFIADVAAGDTEAVSGLLNTARQLGWALQTVETLRRYLSEK
jgi:hypothetical protein